MTEPVSGISEQKAITDGCQGALAGAAVSESLLEGRWAGMGAGGPPPEIYPTSTKVWRKRGGSDGDGSQL